MGRSIADQKKVAPYAPGESDKIWYYRASASSIPHGYLRCLLSGPVGSEVVPHIATGREYARILKGGDAPLRFAIKNDGDDDDPSEARAPGAKRRRRAPPPAVAGVGGSFGHEHGALTSAPDFDLQGAVVGGGGCCCCCCLLPAGKF